MMRIRRLNCFDIPKISKMVDYTVGDDGIRFKKDLTHEAFSLIHTLLPLKYKFRPESYVFLEKNDINGIITISPTMGNPYKMNITRLVFTNNSYDVGKQLVDFVVARYGAKGANSFIVSADSSHDELIQLFLQGCGFRQCSYVNLWKIENFAPETDSKANFRICQNSDARAVAKLFNSELKVHFRPSLEKIKQEYIEPFFNGMTSFYKNRYVLEEPSKKRIISYLSITTSDNQNFIIDMSLNEAYQVPYDEIINFALAEISRRKTHFTAFIKHRQYTKNADLFEEYLHKRNLNCVQTKSVLVKDFYKPAKETENALQVFLFGDNKITVN